MNDENRKKQGAYIPPKDIAFWAPITHEHATMIHRVRGLYKSVGVDIPPYQMIENMIRAFKPPNFNRLENESDPET